ncbi:MAG: glycosyltransferase [Chloroflexi bacterium]|nr:MAG: glycosyltransferase [Chloroflexota bacterium]
MKRGRQAVRGRCRGMAKTSPLECVEVETAPISRFERLLDEDIRSELDQTMAGLADLMRGHVIWNVNSTARGGGVAELLASLIPYSRGAGIDERWAVIEGTPEFFHVTKKLHVLLHGVAADGETLTEDDRREYEAATAKNAAALLDEVRPDDVVILHDPQTAGLIPRLRDRGIRVVWRSHIGVDTPGEVVRRAWAFLLPYVGGADALVFSRRTYAWDGLERSRVEIIPPCIDPFAAKNRDMSELEVSKVLEQASLPNRGPMVLQVSRWDRLKDPAGVMEAFARHVAPRAGALLVLAGPAVMSVTDDPEQPQVLEEVMSQCGRMPDAVREAIVVAQLPMDDVERNALTVNALQRRADVVVQKSIAEGFGLTVAEAMWKGKPVVASRVGGIEDQVEHGKSGVLVDDPHDLRTFGESVVSLLGDPEKSADLGHEARRTVARKFITPCHLIAQGRLILDLLRT